MACNHHPHHHQTNLPPSSSCSCFSSSYSFQAQCPCPSSTSAMLDPLFQAMPSRGFNPSPTPHHARNLISQCQAHQQRFHQQEASEGYYSAISFLLTRVEAMESSLRKLKSSSSSYRFSAGSLRDAAARTIQIHFRAFLVRRSQTLRHFKDLALIKSSFSAIKSSAFNGSRIDFQALSLKIMDLLLILDSIQGSDPMIRDNKKSISRDLVRFLELIKRERNKLFPKSVRNSRFNQNMCKSKVMGSKRGNAGGDQKEMVENLRSRIEKIRGFSRICENDEEDVELEGCNHGSDDDDEDEEYCRNAVENDNQIRSILVKRNQIKAQPKVKRSVRFTGDEHVLNHPIQNAEISSLDESDSSDDHVKLAKNLCNEVEEIKGVEYENEARNTINGCRNGRNDEGKYRGPCEGFVFSAPLPVTMEDEADLVKKRKDLKIRS